MKFSSIVLLTLLLVQSVATVQAQDKVPAPTGGREPPPQAYEDCKGRKVGDAIQHTTPEGKVAATCQESPKGLVARPNQPRGGTPMQAGK